MKDHVFKDSLDAGDGEQIATRLGLEWWVESCSALAQGNVWVLSNILCFHSDGVCMAACVH